MIGLGASPPCTAWDPRKAVLRAKLRPFVTKWWVENHRPPVCVCYLIIKTGYDMTREVRVLSTRLRVGVMGHERTQCVCVCFSARCDSPVLAPLLFFMWMHLPSRHPCRSSCRGPNSCFSLRS